MQNAQFSSTSGVICSKIALCFPDSLFSSIENIFQTKIPKKSRKNGVFLPLVIQKKRELSGSVLFLSVTPVHCTGTYLKHYVTCTGRGPVQYRRGPTHFQKRSCCGEPNVFQCTGCTANQSINGPSGSALRARKF
jgi:hypothetical protein